MSQIFQRYAFFAMLIFITVWAWDIQANTYINLDTGWFLEATQRLMEGGNYTNDFFENNPPWILYLTILPVLFSKIFVVNLVLAMRIYVFSFAVISLSLSYYFLLKSFVKSDLYVARFLTVGLAFLFLILPSFEFGQRENVFFILTMPYLFMMEQRLRGHDVNFYLAIFVGLSSGVVFILKPYFLMTLFLVECYYLINKKNIKAVIRPETIAIMMLLMAYIIIIGLYHRDYLATVLPIATRYCYFGTRNPWVNLFFSQFCLVCYLSVLFCLLTYKLNRFKSLTHIFLLAWLGFFFSYAIQQEDVYYRLIPAYGMSLLILMLSYASYVSTPISIKHSKVYLWVFYFALILLMYLKKTTFLLDYYPLFYSWLSFFMVTLVCGLVLYLLPLKFAIDFYKRFFIAFFLISLFICSLNYYINLTELQALAVDVVAMIVYACLIPADYNTKKYYMAFVFVACLIVLLPFFQLFTMLEITKNNKKYYEGMVNYINNHIPQKSYYFFTTNIPNFMEHHATNASRFSFFWFLPGLVKESYYLKDKKTYDEYHRNKKFFVDMVAEDLAIKKPEWVFVDNLAVKSYLFWRTHHMLIPISFNYLTYFDDNKNFKEVWKHYRYLTTITSYRYTRLNPYQYTLQLSYKHIPEESTVPFHALYLYLNSQHHVEMAFRDENKHFRKIVVSMSENQLHAIKHVLATPGMYLEKRDKMNFFRWVLKQSVEYEVYKYDIYQRSSPLPANA